MRLGIFIRSIGERTEKLCFESANLSLDKSSIHILKDYSPSYKVYREMFKKADSYEYDWFIGLDADVVLVKHWYELLTKELADIDTSVAKITFNVIDYITSSILSRGVHVYNNKYNHILQKELNKNIIAGRLWPLFKVLNKSNYYTKPESSIADRFKNYGLSLKSSAEVIGYHGFEQYYAEIYRQYLVRYNRDPRFIETNSLSFLETDNRGLINQNPNHYAANLGWNKGKSLKVRNVNSQLLEIIKDDLAKKGLSEKEELDLSLDEFYSKYAYMLSAVHA